MSQFPAQAAISSEGQPQRVAGPVNSPVGMGIPSVQPIGVGGGGGIPGVAAMPVPVPNMSAARDLEQALRATQALGSTLIQTGNALNIERQIDERRDTYQAQLKVLQDEPKMLQNFDAGKLNAAIDGSDMDTFVAGQTAGFVGQTEAGTRAYRDAMAQTASKLWVKRNADRQKIEFQNDVLGLHAAMVNPVEGPQPDANTLYDEFSSRYNWLDRSTFMSAVYGSSLKAVAETGDRKLFDQIASGITEDSERTIYVDPIRIKLKSQIEQNMASQQMFASRAIKQLNDSVDPPPISIQKYEDQISGMINDPEDRKAAFVDGYTALLQKSNNLEELNSVDAMAKKNLPPESYQEYERRKQFLRQPIIERTLKAAAMDPHSNFQELAADAKDHIDPVKFNEASTTWVKTIRDSRKDIALNAYSQDPSKRQEIIQHLIDANKRYDPNKPEWQQVKDAVSIEEVGSILDGLDKVDKEIQNVNLVNDVMTGAKSLKPTDANWNTILSRSGAIANGHVMDPDAAAEIAIKTRTVPAAMLDATYGDLMGSEQQAKKGLRLLSSLAVVGMDKDVAPYMLGMSIKDSDPEATRPIVSAIRQIEPMLATMSRDATGKISDSDIDGLYQAFKAAVSDWSNTTLPQYDDVRFNDSLRTSDMYSPSGGGQISVGTSIVQQDANGSLSKPFRAAVYEQFYRRFKDKGMSNEASITMAEWSASKLMSSVTPLLGNFGVSKNAVGSRMDEIEQEMGSQFHFPKIDGNGFMTIVPKQYAPNASFDEALFKEQLAERKISKDDISDVFPSIGEGNSFWVLHKQKLSNGKISTKFDIVDLGKAMVEKRAAADAAKQQDIRQHGMSIRQILAGAQERIKSLPADERIRYAEEVNKTMQLHRARMLIPSWTTTDDSNPF